MKSNWTFALLVIATLATNDAFAAKAKSADFTPRDVSEKALVLLSTSADETSLAGGTFLALKRVEIKNGKEKLKHFDGFYVDNPTVKSHSQTERMNVHWRALAPGEYVLERALLNPYACFTTFVSYRFTVAAGMRIYLGDFHVQQRTLTLRDSYERDLAYFRLTAGGERPESFSRAPPQEKSEPNPTCERHF